MEQTATKNPLDAIEEALQRLVNKLPRPLQPRFRNALEQFEGAYRLFDIDKEMASFRAITGEEEAATCLMRAVQLKGYTGAEGFRPYRHQHKAAVMACVIAIGTTLLPLLREFQLIFDFDQGRVDVKVPLSAFGVGGGDRLAIQPVEPLDLLHSRPGIEEHNVFTDALANLAAKANYPSIKKLVSTQANARNKLLYASDTALPKSQATLQDIAIRKNRTLAMLVLAVMVLQSSKQLAMVVQAIPAFLKVITRIPSAAGDLE